MIDAYDIERIKLLGKATNVFYFKQFSIKDDRSTMKVGTDAVLLGIAIYVSGANHILEAGTGCGVIALSLAQRSSAFIDALEVDADSVDQARENASRSPWQDRINIIHCSLQEYTSDKKYDLIVTNPPFFSGTYKSRTSRRNISRHNELLTFEELIRHSARLLAEKGSLWLILPAKESLQFIRKAKSCGFFMHYMLKFIPRAGKEHNRVIMQFNKEKTSDIRIETLTHRDADGKFSEEFIRFTGAFYIDF